VKIFRKLYDWGLKQAESNHAQRALFWVAFAESSFFPLPPDVLLIAMVLAARTKWLRYFAICLIGSILGGTVGYLLGTGVWYAVQDFFFTYVFSIAAFEKVQALYIRYDFWIVFAAAFTPIPYKVFTIAAGVASIDFWHFLIASIVGRGGRFFMVAFLLEKFGAPMKAFIEKYFNLLTFVFLFLLIGGFVIIKYFIH
jgi:membrane protein YqaA with SNARE-associated domain